MRKKKIELGQTWIAYLDDSILFYRFTIVGQYNSGIWEYNEGRATACIWIGIKWGVGLGNPYKALMFDEYGREIRREGIGKDFGYFRLTERSKTKHGLKIGFPDWYSKVEREGK